MASGRALTFAEWGEPSGFPIFSLHGTPGSRLERHYDERKYVEAGARVITYDRPGYGCSDRNPGRAVVDCVADVAAIADMLSVERFAVTGASGGGPHALAVAARLPERVSRAACVVSIAPFHIEGFDWFEGMDPLNVREFQWAMKGEEVLAHEVEREATAMRDRVEDDPANVIAEDFDLSEADRAELARPERGDVIRQSVNEAFRTGVWGWVDDMLAFTRAWGFDVSEIHIPTRVIYGLTDVLTPVAHGQWLARNIPAASAVAEEHLGHVASPELVAERLSWLIQPA